MPTAVQPNNSTTRPNHTVEVTSSIALIMGLIAIIIVAVWITNLNSLRNTPPAFVTRTRTNQERRQKRVGGYTVDAVPLVRYTFGLQGNMQQITTTGDDCDTQRDVPNRESRSGIDSGTRPGSGNEALACSVCTEDFVEKEKVRILPCRHIYHQHCIDPWLFQMAGTCPLCRAALGDRVRSQAHIPAPPAPVLLRNGISYGL
ncbi:hypothetical protein N431DRAFT_499467 [Stipitochalara longipes BDJ]|nr:hypothetical protein N431DRAFT_499467 [Stipitochalara longipes BDJ]